MKKSRSAFVLTIAILFLFVVLLGEIYFLFFKKEAQIPEQPDKKSATQTKGKGSDPTYQKRPAAEVKYALDFFSELAKELKPVMESGVLQTLELTETYKTTITGIGNSILEDALPDGTKVTYVFTLSFATLSKEGEKEVEYEFTKQELERVNAFKMVNEEEVPTDIDSLKKGDSVDITIVSDMFAAPVDNLISMKIVKLP